MVDSEDEQRVKQFRVYLQGESIKEYEELKSRIGTVTESETMRVIIHLLHKAVKSGYQL